MFSKQNHFWHAIGRVSTLNFVKLKNSERFKRESFGKVIKKVHLHRMLPIRIRVIQVAVCKKTPKQSYVEFRGHS